MAEFINGVAIPFNNKPTELKTKEPAFEKISVFKNPILLANAAI